MAEYLSTTGGSSVDRNPDQSAEQPDTIVEEQYSEPQNVPIYDGPPKRSTRQRLFRGLSRMPSTASLSGVNRARSASTPYTRSSASLSCVSLSTTPSPFAPPSTSSSVSRQGTLPLASPAITESTDGYMSPLSSPSSHTTPFPPFPYSAARSESANAIRKVDLAGVASGGTAALPPDMIRTASLPLFPPRPKKTFIQLWDSLPYELAVRVLSFLRPKELVCLSRVNRQFHKLCFDGQLWTFFDASEFYQEIPVESLSKIITAAGPFVKDLNLRGCAQLEKYQDALLMSGACNNLVNATLEGCNLSSKNLDRLLKRNQKLAHINLTGLTCVNSDSCRTIAEFCTQLEILNLSWCKNLTAKGARIILGGCKKLRDLRVGEVRGFSDLGVAQTFFEANQLERLIMSGCSDLTDDALIVMIHGINPPIDLLTDRPNVPPRTLRHLDLSRCNRLTDRGVNALGHFVPELEGLVLSGLTALTDAALEPIVASTPRLSYLDLEDLSGLTNDLFSEHLSKAPCAETLTHLSISYCEEVGDAGVLPLIRACKSLRSLDMDNTRVTDLALVEASTMVRARSSLPGNLATRPYTGLSIVVYDCPNISWTGVREVMSRNAEILMPRPTGVISSVPGGRARAPPFPTEIIALKCFYGWQMTVDEHTKRVLRGKYTSAARLERKWADYMQANEEAGVEGAGGRRRRRRARVAQQVHANEQVAGAAAGTDDAESTAGNPVPGIGRQRARTSTCAIM